MFRTIVIKNTSKLQYMQGYMLIYDGTEERKVFLNEVSLLIIEAVGSLITVPLLNELIKRNIIVIFCDEKHNPFSSIHGLQNNYRSSGNIFEQINWDEKRKKEIWKEIIKKKISMQIEVLKLLNKGRVELLSEYANQVEDDDITNREGISAKVYFNDLFGQEFNRSEETVINKILNYGYSIVLSCFNREITGSGHLTQLGIKHIGKTNPFNLSCDLMEPFRPIVDLVAIYIFNLENPIAKMRKLFSYKININSENRFLDDAIRVYTMQILRLLNNESNEMPRLKIKSLEDFFGE